MEIWKDVKGYEGLYQVSNLGNVKSSRTNKKLYCSYSRGYHRVALCKGNRRMYSVHRLVAEAFIPNPDKKPCVNHRDCNKSNNIVNNLEWCTYRENNNYKDHMLKAKVSSLYTLVNLKYSDNNELVTKINELKLITSKM